MPRSRYSGRDDDARPTDSSGLRRRWPRRGTILALAAAMALVSCSPAGVPQKEQPAPVSVPPQANTVQRPAPTLPAAPVARQPSPSGSEFTPVSAQDGKVSLATADLSGGRALFYSLQSGSYEIAFFVVQGSDGVVRAALDACDVCYPSKKGYHQEGDVMVCNNCGSRFPLTLINVEKGGCNPAPLNPVVQDDQVVILLAELQAGARYF